MKHTMHLISLAFAALALFCAADVTRDTEWQDVPPSTRVGTVVDLGHGGGGLDTNAVQSIIQANVETNNLCTVAAAMAMTNGVPSVISNAFPIVTNAYTKSETDAEIESNAHTNGGAKAYADANFRTLPDNVCRSNGYSATRFTSNVQYPYSISVERKIVSGSEGYGVSIYNRQSLFGSKDVVSPWSSHELNVDIIGIQIKITFETTAYEKDTFVTERYVRDNLFAPTNYTFSETFYNDKWTFSTNDIQYRIVESNFAHEYGTTWLYDLYVGEQKRNISPEGYNHIVGEYESVALNDFYFEQDPGRIVIATRERSLAHPGDSLVGSSYVPSTNGLVTASVTNGLVTAAAATNAAETVFAENADYALTNLTAATLSLRSGEIGNYETAADFTLALSFADNGRSGDCLLYVANTDAEEDHTIDITPNTYKFVSADIEKARTLGKATTNLVMFTRLKSDTVLVSKHEVK